MKTSTTVTITKKRNNMVSVVFSHNIERAEAFISKRFVEQRNFKWTTDKLTARNPANGHCIRWCSTPEQIKTIEDIGVIYVDSKISKDFARKHPDKDYVEFHI